MGAPFGSIPLRRNEAFMAGHGQAGHLSASMFANAFRAAGQINDLTVARRLTTLLRFGTPGTPEDYYMGNSLFFDLPRGGRRITVVREDDGHFDVTDTTLGIEEPYPEIQYSMSTEEFLMADQGLKFGLADELLASSDVEFELLRSGQRRLLRAMNLDLENVKAAVLDPANFPVANTLDLSGSPVDQVGGDGKAAIVAMEAAIFAANPGYRREDIEIYFTQRAYDAFEGDKALEASRSNIDFGTPTKADIAKGLGYSEDQLFTKDAFANEAGLPVSLWGDQVYLKLRRGSDGERHDPPSKFGVDEFAINHIMRPDAPSPFRDEDRRKTFYPILGKALPIGHTLIRGAVISNSGG